MFQQSHADIRRELGAGMPDTLVNKQCDWTLDKPVCIARYWDIVTGTWIPIKPLAPVV